MLTVAWSVPLIAAEPVVPLRSLKGVPVPEPSNLDSFVRDRKTAIVLGKALFWDMQTGSDGIQACASCHFNAGTDNRSKNQISPATARVNSSWQPAPDYAFALGGGPNYQLTPGDFPFNRNQPAIVSSQGIHKAQFIDVIPGSAVDTIQVLRDTVFQVGGVNVRQAPNRATPSVINAVFNHRQFWDGRAQSIFNGINNWGDRDPKARVLRARNPAQVDLVAIQLANSSLASQAVGPPTNDLETSAAGRMLADIGMKFTPHDKKDRDNGKKLSTLRPLSKQLVALDDSVLGPYSAWPNRGLTGADGASYVALIQKAFRPEWWDCNKQIAVDAAGVPYTVTGNAARGIPTYSLLEYNFSLFFGLAVQMYEATLISDDSPFDRYMDGNLNALNPQQLKGLALFQDKDNVRCINCHGGAEFTNASVTSAGNKPLFRRSGNLLDTGFNNIGLRPTSDDLGIGGVDLNGKPLSVARMTKLGYRPDPGYDPVADSALGVDGAFKTPGLRNIALTAPYFHTGGMLTLRHVIDFYTRAGDQQPIISRDGNVFPLHLPIFKDPENDKQALIAFLGALTDDRVRYARAPFDHPEIYVPNGHQKDTKLVYNDGTGRAIDDLKWIPAVGKNGSLLPIRGFLE